MNTGKILMTIGYLPRGQTINGPYYCSQITLLKNELLQSIKKEFCFILTTQDHQRLKEVVVKGEILLYPPYSPDIVKFFT